MAGIRPSEFETTTLTFYAAGVLNADGTIDSGSYQLTETIGYEYLVTESIAGIDGSSGGTRTSAGDYSLTRYEGHDGQGGQPLDGSFSDSSESWSYNGSAASHTFATLSGIYGEQMAGGDKQTTLDAAVVSNGSSTRQGSSSASGTYSSRPDGDTSSGSGSSSITFQSNASISESATIHRVDDLFRLIGSGSLGYGSSATTSSQSSGSSHTEGGDVTTDMRYSSRQGATAASSGRATTSYQTTDKSSQVTGHAGSSLVVQASSASQGVGTIVDSSDPVDIVTTVIRNSKAGTYSLAASQNGTFDNNRPELGNGSRSANGSIHRLETTAGKSTSFTGTDDGFSLIKASSQKSENDNYNYADDNGAISQRGSFDSDEKSTVETTGQISTVSDDGNTVTFARSDTSGNSQRGLTGTFTEKDSNRQAAATVKQSQTSFAASESRYSTKESGENGNRSGAQSASNSMSFSLSDSVGLVSLEDGVVEGQASVSTYGADSRVHTKGSSFDIQNSAVTVEGSRFRYLQDKLNTSALMPLVEQREYDKMAALRTSRLDRFFIVQNAFAGFVGVGSQRNVGVLGTPKPAGGKFAKPAVVPVEKISGVPIKGFCGSKGANPYHALDRAIQRGVSPKAILDTIKKPAVVVKQPGGHTLYLTKDAAVVLDNNGQAVTIWGGVQHTAKTLDLLRAAGALK